NNNNCQLFFLQHDFQLPKNYKEKEAFRQLIRDGIRTNENGTQEEEENFDEAIKNVNTALNATKICSSVEEIFRAEQCENITSQVRHFSTHFIVITAQMFMRTTICNICIL
ncbi:hypothetical protein PDJAM_G00267340, partial [Pangasius djambal]|nr:hypothetical protein [Pangasius djambal]